MCLKAYRYGFNGKEKDDNGEFGNTHYDFGARIYNPTIGRFLSVDPINMEFPMLSPYQYARNMPIKFLDIGGLYAGEKTRSVKSFIGVFRAWQVAALHHRKVTVHTQYNTNDSRRFTTRESDNAALLRVFNHDITSKTQDQFVTNVGGVNGTFSYYRNFGNDKGGAFVDVGGFPLDVKHFFKNVELGNTVGEFVGNKISVDEEYWQGIDPDANDAARTSSFSPEDLLSNSLGLIFSRYDDNGDFAGDLEGFLGEASTLFSTNELSGGKYITDSDVGRLRSMIQRYHGTDDFRDFNKNGDIFNSENMRNNRNQRTSEISDFYRGYLENVHSNLK
ncbi:MAG: RHS repeat-associated core domain-containing protein [Bacteroidota bacterium]